MDFPIKKFFLKNTADSFLVKLLLPSLEMATTRQVADFYKVDANTLYKLVYDNKEEITSDGSRLFKKDEVMKSLSLHDVRIENSRGKSLVIFENGDEIQVATRGMRLFPKRAILRVGMLLRDSLVKLPVQILV